MRSNVYPITLLLLLLTGLFAGNALAQTACLSIERSVTGCAIAGAEVEVSVTISSTCGQVTALGLRETIPTGWAYQGFVSGDEPGLQSAIGATGTLEFAWLDIPVFPATFKIGRASCRERV